MNAITYQKDDQNIVTLLLDAPGKSANIMDEAFQTSFKEVTEKLQKETELKGVIFQSAKESFFAGGDLSRLCQVTEERVGEFFQGIEAMKLQMRTIETLGVPVVSCINGAALGGGWEICLATHHRICLKNPKTKLGLPEVTLGLLPGAGGISRMTRLLGIEAALPYLVEGRQFKPEDGLKAGLVHEIVDTKEAMTAAAKKWIEQNPKTSQPFDVRGYKIPGGTPSSPKLAPRLAVAPAMLIQKTHGCYPAPKAILACAVEGAQVDIDTALRIESRYLTELAKGDVAKNMINTFWFQMNEVKAGKSRPQNIAPKAVKKVGVLGAGMMGAGIAYASAAAGVDVILKDTEQAKAEKGKAYSEKILKKRLDRGKLSPEKMQATLDRITPTADLKGFEDVDLVIEAVFENRELKWNVTQETEAVISGDAIFASNTSTLPITGLAEAAKRPKNFIGLHFFSPVDKMQLVEIIKGEQTSAETLARAFDFVQQIRKIPIVVNDSRGFFTSRVFGTFTNEGIAMLGEGQDPATIEQMALQVGMPVGPLAISDEVSLSLMTHIKNQTKKDLESEGKTYSAHPSEPTIEQMVKLGREGRAKGAGFYEYPEKGKKYLWKGLKDTFPQKPALPLQDMKDRLLFIQALESVRSFEEGVLTSVRDANIGSIFGIGFAAWTGGALQFINQYGVKKFTARALELKELYGERFTPPALLMNKAEKDEPFKD